MSEPRDPGSESRLLKMGFVATVVLLVLLAAAYLDLRSRVSDLRVEIAALGAGAQTATPTPAAEQPDEGGAPDAGPAPGFRSYNLDVAGTPEDWICDGTIASEMVQTVVGAHGAAVFDCYRERRLELPDLAGTVVVYAKVGESGRSERVRVVGSIEDTTLRACIATHAALWVFPPPVGGECAVVQIPFALQPETEER